MGDNIPLRLPKRESLTDVKLIDRVFKSSLSIKAFPLIFSYNFHEISEQASVQVLFSVPKRKFKKAVDRNRLKRLMRECFRLKKQDFMAALAQRSLYGAFIYTNREISDFTAIDKSFSKIILKLHENPGN